MRGVACRGVCFAPDGGTLVAGYADGWLRVLDVQALAVRGATALPV